MDLCLTRTSTWVLQSLGRGYVASTVVHRTFRADSLLGTETTDAVRALLDAYAKLLESGALQALNQDVAQETATTMPAPEAAVSPAHEDVGAAARAFSEAVETSGLRLPAISWRRSSRRWPRSRS